MTLQIDGTQREETEIAILQQTFETPSFETVLWVELLFRRIAIVNKQQTGNGNSAWTNVYWVIFILEVIISDIDLFVADISFYMWIEHTFIHKK